MKINFFGACAISIILQENIRESAAQFHDSTVPLGRICANHKLIFKACHCVHKLLLSQ